MYLFSCYTCITSKKYAGIPVMCIYSAKWNACLFCTFLKHFFLQTKLGEKNHIHVHVILYWQVENLLNCVVLSIFPEFLNNILFLKYIELISIPQKNKWYSLNDILKCIYIMKLVKKVIGIVWWCALIFYIYYMSVWYCLYILLKLIVIHS